jgi:transposase
MSSRPWTFTLAGFKINEIREEHGCLHVQAASITQSKPCPSCTKVSVRVHSYYHRTLKDLPVADYTVQLDLTVPRFRCLNPKCTQKTFVEPLTGLALKHAQRTQRFTCCGTALGMALGGEAGQRVASKLHLPLSADTLLRMIRQQPLDVGASASRVIGIDDWAFKRSTSYGTLIVDLEQHRPIELLSERTSGTVAAWLKQHPEIEIVTRDRSTEFARGISLGAPQAKQVADRWHLLKNLNEVLERILANVRTELNQLPPLSHDANEPVIRRLEKRSKNERMARAARRENRLRRYEEVRGLHADGVSIKRIAERLKLSRTTVRKFVKAKTYPEIAPHSRAGALTRFEPYLCQRWKEGCRNALQLWREVCAQGYRGTHRQVSKWVGMRREEPRSHSDIRKRRPVPTPMATSPPQAMSISPTTLPSAKRLAWLLVKDQEQLDEKEQLLLQYVLQHPVVAKCHVMAHQFIRMVRQRLSKELAVWLKACLASKIVEFASFADGLESDIAAVRAALEMDWSNGQLEGQVNRLKLIKRQMYGRANFDLLRIRVLSET